jgi:hypothetical protein
MSLGLWPSLQQVGLAAARPVAPSESPAGTFLTYFATDTGAYSIWNGTAWVPLSSGVVTNVKATYAIPVLPKQTLYLDAVAGFVATLPVATGSGNVVDAVVKTTLTSGAYEFSVTSGDSIAGTVIASKTTTPTPYSATLGTTANVSLTFTTVGAGIKGDQLSFKDVAPNVWEVLGHTWVSGTVASPFS